MKASLQGQHVVIIGGSSGIGLEVARGAHALGAKLTIASRSRERVEQAARDIGPDVLFDTVDTLDERSVERFFARREQIDHLAVLAGDSMSGGVLTADLPTARNAMESKFWGQWYVGRHGGPHICPGGSLILTGGSGPRPHQAMATVAANAGVSLLVQSLAKELAPVRVNAVAPYYTDTPMWSALPKEERSALFARVAGQLPLGRVAGAQDVAPTYLHLMESPYITGVTVPVDGGAILQTIQ